MSLDQSQSRLLRRPLWVVIAAGGAIIGLSLGIRHTLGLFLEPISADLGVGREVFALAMGFQNLFWGLSAPLFGAIADKYGSGRVVVVGGIIYAAGLILTANAGSRFDLIGSGMLLGLGISATGFTAVLGAVGRAAPPEKRQMALTFASMGGSMGQFVLLPYTQAIMNGFGWVVCLLVLAGTAAVTVVLAWGVAGDPQSHETEHDTQTVTESFQEAIRHRSFLLLTAGFFVCGLHVTFVASHLPAFVADQGMESWVGAACLAIIGFVNLIGTYLFGRWGTVTEKRIVLSWLYFGRALVFAALLIMPLNVPTILIFSVLIGLFWLATVPLTSALVVILFGPKWMSMLFGIVFISHQIGAFLGAWLGGYIYDRTQSYDAMWWISVALGLMAAVLHWPIKEKPVPRLEAARQSAA